MDINQTIAKELSINTWQVEAVVKLIDEGNTIPFIARYRKEAHGSLDDEQLRSLDERLKYLRSLEERKETILKSIEEQGKLTDELRLEIASATTLVALEDIYRPYRQKRRTRATIAKEKGLEPLADIIVNDQNSDPGAEALAFIDPDKDVNNELEAITGAMDIIAERISDEADHRTNIRRMTWQEGSLLTTEKKSKSDSDSDEDSEKSGTKTNAKLAERRSVYETYHDFSSPLKKLQGYQILAINRGEREKFLTVKIEAPTEEIT
ncbi:MAG: RNA-binding transcriptional accessory protein, partial [Eubacterium sp.]|nr:RNA-binding transcriptional accessory protein [Eubacterium sp.]